MLQPEFITRLREAFDGHPHHSYAMDLLDQAEMLGAPPSQLGKNVYWNRFDGIQKDISKLIYAAYCESFAEDLAQTGSRFDAAHQETASSQVQDLTKWRQGVRGASRFIEVGGQPVRFDQARKDEVRNTQESDATREWFGLLSEFKAQVDQAYSDNKRPKPGRLQRD